MNVLWMIHNRFVWSTLSSQEMLLFWFRMQCLNIYGYIQNGSYIHISTLGVRIMEISSEGTHIYLKKRIPQMWKSSDLKNGKKGEEKSNLCQVLYVYLHLYMGFIIVISIFFLLFSKVQCSIWTVHGLSFSDSLNSVIPYLFSHPHQPLHGCLSPSYNDEICSNVIFLERLPWSNVNRSPLSDYWLASSIRL